MTLSGDAMTAASDRGEIRDSQRLGIPHLLVIPSLVMTFMLGPIGLLFYFAIRTAKTRALELEEA